jgi:hypothetical protein
MMRLPGAESFSNASIMGKYALLVGILTNSLKQASDLEPAKKRKRKGEQGNGQSKASGGQDMQQEQPETGRQNRGRVGQE